MAFDAEDDRSDAALLALYGRGDPMAARVLTGRLAPVAFRVAYRMLGEMAEAEDVAQEAMLRLWKQAPDWQSGGAKVSTWLYRVVANLATRPHQAAAFGAARCCPGTGGHGPGRGRAHDRGGPSGGA